MIKDFKEFALRGNVVDMAVGILIGGAFGTIAKSLVEDVLMPPLGLLLGRVDFTNLFIVLKGGDPAGPYATLADAKAAGAVSLNYGVFLTSVVSFLVVALVVFFCVRLINRLRRAEEAPAEEAPKPRTCPFCFTEVNQEATRCPACTSQLKEI
jgi:large conductance mechanosensitive channel